MIESNERLAESMTTTKPAYSILTSLTREPTVLFALLALMIFLLNALAGRNSGQESSLLEIDRRELDARILMQEISQGEEASAQLKAQIEEAFIEEQILVREAIALGLDNDSRIHDMLAQKMRHVLSGGVIQPTDEELSSFYSENRDRYRSEARVSVDELVLDNEEQRLSIASLLSSGASIEEILDALGQSDDEGSSAGRLNDASARDLSNIFSEEYSAQVFAADLLTWVGPFDSNRGQHWLRILERTPAATPPLQEIIDRVRLEWIAVEEESKLALEISALRDAYQIRIVEGSLD